MNIVYIVCFIVLGSAGIANVIAFIFLILCIINRFWCNPIKFCSANFSFKFYVSTEKKAEKFADEKELLFSEGECDYYVAAYLIPEAGEIEI